MRNIDVEEFKKICAESATMALAAAKLELSFTTFARYAKKLGVYTPNQGGKGTNKFSNVNRTIDVTSIVEGNHPHFQTNKLKHKLLKAGILQEECSICGISEWCNKKLVLELDHINGKNRDHRLENLRLLCPNCHSQTSTFRGRNKKS